jgi:hypothetical protein
MRVDIRPAMPGALPHVAASKAGRERFWRALATAVTALTAIAAILMVSIASVVLGLS